MLWPHATAVAQNQAGFISAAEPETLQPVWCYTHALLPLPHTSSARAPTQRCTQWLQPTAGESKQTDWGAAW